MKKNGFTLVELIAVIVLIALVSMLSFPSIRNLMKNNNEQEFKTYEDMMVNYAKTMPEYKTKTASIICLNELKKKGLKEINSNTICNGYVSISSDNIVPYLICQKGEEQLFKSIIDNDTTWTIPSECEE